MDEYCIDTIPALKIILDAMENEQPQIVAAIKYAQTLICRKPYESGFVVGKDGWRYFTTESVPRYMVFFFVDENKKSIWLMKMEVLEEAE